MVVLEAVTGISVRRINVAVVVYKFRYFFFSALLDNLAAAIVIMAVLRKLVPDRTDRLKYACMVIMRRTPVAHGRRLVM